MKRIQTLDLNPPLYKRHLSIFRLVLSSITFVFWSVFCLGQTANTNKELHMKAAYIYNFTRFVYWDSQKSDSMIGAITIFIFGDDSLGNLLEEFAQKQLHGRPIKIQKIKNEIFDISKCRLLFISRSEKQQLPAILKKTSGYSILTISDIEGFAQIGGMVGFTEINGKVKIEVNLSKTRRAGLKISAKFLELAKIVSSED